MRRTKIALAPLALACASSLTLLALPFAHSPAVAQDGGAEQSATATLSVTFTGYSQSGGQIRFGLYDEAGWSDGEPVRGATIDLAKGQTTATFEGLPAGTYGIKAFHDANGNGDMDLNPFGIPTEAFAFSNNAPARMGPATWQDAAFKVTAGENSHSITIK